MKCISNMFVRILFAFSVLLLFSAEAFASSIDVEDECSAYSLDGITFSLNSEWSVRDYDEDAWYLFESSDQSSFISVFTAVTELSSDEALDFCVGMITDDFEDDNYTIHDLLADDQPVKEIVRTKIDNGTAFTYCYYVFNISEDCSVIAHVQFPLSTDDIPSISNFYEMLNTFVAPDGTSVGNIGLATEIDEREKNP